MLIERTQIDAYLFSDWLQIPPPNITKIVNDKYHYLHNLITVLPHGHVRAIKCTAERSRKTFLPVAVKLFNAK